MFSNSNLVPNAEGGLQIPVFTSGLATVIPGQHSKATSTNPKDLLGQKKVPLGSVPAVAIAHEACAMLDGELKYGFRNWRAKDVKAMVYVHAAMRHIEAWSDKEEIAPDSGVHHLGHARACLGILLDAQENGNLIDDRSEGSYPETAEFLSRWVANRIAKAQDQLGN